MAQPMPGWNPAVVTSVSWPHGRAWQRLLALCLSIAILLAGMPTGSWVLTTPCHPGSFSGTPNGTGHQDPEALQWERLHPAPSFYRSGN